MSTDKWKHMAVCATVAMCAMGLMRIIHALPIVAVLASLLCAISIGAGKEYGDYCNPNNRWDWYDLLFDLLGGCVGSAIGILLWI